MTFPGCLGSSQEADSWEKNQGGNVEKRTVFQWLNTPIFLKCCFWKMKVHSVFFVKNVLVFEI